MVEFVSVRTAEEVGTVAALAREVWVRHYTPIVGAAQVAYMLERFQSAAAVTRQIAEGYAYYLVLDEGAAAGYFALVADAAAGSLMLSKIYILPERQGRGLGKAVVAFAEREGRALGLGRLWLTVNRNNAASIAFYERAGFVKESEVVKDIGGGFVMDDHIMAKPLAG